MNNKEVIIVGYSNVSNEGIVLHLNKPARTKNGTGEFEKFWFSWDKIGESLFEDYTQKQSVNELNELRKKFLNLLMITFLILTNFIVFANFAVSQNEISQSDRDAIIYVVQEEKVAHDFYNAMYELHGIISFRSISKSEGLHIDQAKELIEHFGIEDPNKENYDNPGSFKNPKFAEMYNNLVRNGTNSIIDALIEAARFEEIDIVDIQRFVSFTQNEYLKTSFEKLYGVSENHLKALVKELFERGVEYTPKYLSPEQYNKIITAKK